MNEGRATARSRDFLTAREIRAERDLELRDAYAVISRLRREYLRISIVRGGDIHYGEPSVLLNGTLWGGVESLRSVPAWTVEEVRFVRPEDALQRYGSQYPFGLIVLKTHR